MIERLTVPVHVVALECVSTHPKKQKHVNVIAPAPMAINIKEPHQHSMHDPT